MPLRDVIDLDGFPIDRPASDGYAALVARCRDELGRDGMFNLTGFLKPEAAPAVAAEMAPVLAAKAFTHTRSHNIYFEPEMPGLAADHPALTPCTTTNHTVCADQIAGSMVMDVYRYAPLLRFLAETMDKERLYLMADPLARVNVMTYRAGDGLDWHFDRSEFTTTLMLQGSESGGAFEYRSDLRTADDPNYAGVGRLLKGEDPDVRLLALSPGTLNIFRGKNTAHRVTPVAGARARMIAVFSYYDRPDVNFSQEERIGFYGRAA